MALLFGACAKAGPGGTGDDDDDVPAIDANTPIDSMESPDSTTGPQPRALTQSNSTTITDDHSVTCNQFAPPPPATPHTRSAENRFFRVFDLPALGINTTYTATRIDFGIEDLATTTGTVTLKVKLHTLSAAPTGNTFPLANLTQIYTQDVPLPAQTLTTQMIPLTTPVIVPAGSRLVAEIYAPDLTGGADGNYFFPGSNAAGETGSTYIQATACTINDPTKASTLLTPDPQMHLILTIQGTVP